MERDISERIEKSLAKSGTIQGIANALQSWMKAVFLDSPLRPIKTFLNGTWLEHPLHPVFTDVAVGAWTVLVILDLIVLIFGTPNLGVASGIVNAIGILGALAAIATGLMDWMDVDSPELSIGVFHGLTNIAATVLFAIGFVILWANGWTIGVADTLFAILGFLVVTAGAYIGGILVYRLGVMINRDAYTAGPEEFVSVLPMGDLPENMPTRVNANGRPVVLVRKGEEVYALSAVCSHYGGPLDEGQLTDGSIQCPWHYSRFALDSGGVKAGPATAPVPLYQVRLHDGQIQVKAVETVTQ